MNQCPNCQKTFVSGSAWRSRFGTYICSECSDNTSPPFIAADKNAPTKMTESDIVDALVNKVLKRISENTFPQQAYLIANIVTKLQMAMINIAMKAGVEQMIKQLEKDSEE